MKKFLIAGSSLAAVAAAGSAGAVDVTLGGSINMGVEFGLGKNANDLAFSDAFNEVSLSIAAAHTTDGGLSFGGNFTMGTAASIEFAPYADAAGDKFLAKRTVDGRTNINANLWNVSGGGSVASANVVSVKINSAWMGIDQEQVEYTLALGSFTSSNICKLAGRGSVTGGSLGTGLYAANPAGVYTTTGTAASATAARGANGRLAGATGGYLPAGQLFGTLSAAVSATSTTATNTASIGGPTVTAVLSTTRGASAAITAGNGLTATSSTALKEVVSATFAGTAGDADLNSYVVAAYSKAAVNVDGDSSYEIGRAHV